MYNDHERIPKSFIPFGYFFHRINIFFEHCYWLRIYENYRKLYQLPDSFSFRGNNILIIEREPHTFYAGRESYIRGDSRINLTGGNVTVGCGCKIAQRLNIHTSGSYTNDILKGKPSKNWVNESRGDVIIGNNVWIGDDVTIISPVKIGDSSVIAAGSIITKDVQPRTIVAGNPARIVKQ